MYSMFFSTSNYASLLSVQDLQQENWTRVLPWFRAGEGYWVPFKTGTREDTRSSLLLSLDSVEICNISTTAAWCFPREGAPQLPTTTDQSHSTSSSCCQQSTSTFEPVHRKEKACPAVTWSLHQHPSSTGSFWTKILLPRFCFLPVPRCFCLFGAREFVFLNWRIVCSVVSFVSLSQPHDLEQRPLHHLVLVLLHTRAAQTAASLFSFFLFLGFCCFL